MKKRIASVGEDMEKLGSSNTADGIIKKVHLGEHFGSSSESKTWLLY